MAGQGWELVVLVKRTRCTLPCALAGASRAVNGCADGSCLAESWGQQLGDDGFTAALLQITVICVGLQPCTVPRVRQWAGGR